MSLNSSASSAATQIGPSVKSKPVQSRVSPPDASNSARPSSFSMRIPPPAIPARVARSAARHDMTTGGRGYGTGGAGSAPRSTDASRVTLATPNARLAGSAAGPVGRLLREPLPGGLPRPYIVLSHLLIEGQAATDPRPPGSRDVQHGLAADFAVEKLSRDAGDLSPGRLHTDARTQHALVDERDQAAKAL